jgi:hypothetical protein
MPEVSAGEYLHSLLQAFQNAEKIYCQSVADVVDAEIRRDVAMKQKDEAFSRLEEAREKFSGGTMVKDRPDDPAEKNSLSKSNRLPNRRISRVKSSTFGKNSPNKNHNNNYDPTSDENKNVSNSASSSGVHHHMVSTTDSDPLGSNANEDVSFTQDKKPLPIVQSSRAGSKKAPSIFRKGTSSEVHHPMVSTTVSDPFGSNDNEDIGFTHDKTPPSIIQSPRAGTKKAPSIFRKGTGGRLSQSNAIEKRSSTRAGILDPLSSPMVVYELSKGRTREWLDTHLDCDRVGLVRKFYQASFGTKTNQETKKLSVSTIVLNDEWNDLVTSTSEIQELYVSKNTNSPTNANSATSGHLQPSLKDKAAEALVSPQKEPIALFFAPKKKREPSNLFYAGHWRVIDGHKLDPPSFVKGQARQCQVKFEFVGVDRTIVDAMNED